MYASYDVEVFQWKECEVLRSEAEAKQQASDALTKDQAEAVAATSRNSKQLWRHHIYIYTYIHRDILHIPRYTDVLYTVELQYNYTLSCSYTYIYIYIYSDLLFTTLFAQELKQCKAAIDEMMCKGKEHTDLVSSQEQDETECKSTYDTDKNISKLYGSVTE